MAPPFPFNFYRFKIDNEERDVLWIKDSSFWQRTKTLIRYNYILINVYKLTFVFYSKIEVLKIRKYEKKEREANKCLQIA